MIELQLKLLGDRLRNRAFADALKKVIVPGNTVLSDIGSGTGYLSFLASRFGAKECYLYEYDQAILHLSEQLAKKNKVKNCHFIGKHSADVKRGVASDVIVSETLGNYALEENIIENMEDSKRFLKLGGTLIPGRVEQFIAPFTSPRLMKEIDIFDQVDERFDWDLVRKGVLGNMFVYRVKPEDLLKASALRWDDVDFSTKQSSIRKREVSWKIEESATVYGFAIWWVAELVPGVTLSTSPFDAPTHWDQIYLPLLKPLQLGKGDQLRVELKSDSRYEVGIRLQWKVTHLDSKGKVLEQQSLDTGKGW